MCGFVGIVGQQDCSADILLGMQALQHRGQDCAGVGTIHQGHFPVIRKLGLVAQGFGPEEVAKLPGAIGIGHVRYPTVGSGSIGDVQPFFYRQPGILMAHNGNFTNVQQLQQLLDAESVRLFSQCDVEPVLCIFALELMQRRRKDHTTGDAIAALKTTFQKAKGAYSMAAALILDGMPTLLAVRDPFGIRPAVWGRKGGAAIVASESVALDALNAVTKEDIAPGQVMIFRPNLAPIRNQLQAERPAPCVFEYIYFARPDSLMNGESVYSVRLSLGRELARAWKTKDRKADVVIPIPDTARPSAGALAEELGIPFREGFIKNRYTGRTFIMPSPRERNTTLRLKLNPIRSEFSGKRVLVVDDSIVRGTTLNRTIQLIREQKPKEIHLAIHSPPVIHPCYYGIDMSTREDLIAAKFLDPQNQDPLSPGLQEKLERSLARQLGLDSLCYLRLSELNATFQKPRCAACFDGNYPLAVSEQERRFIEQDRRTCSQRELFL